MIMLAPPCKEYSRLKLRLGGPKALRTPFRLHSVKNCWIARPSTTVAKPCSEQWSKGGVGIWEQRAEMLTRCGPSGRRPGPASRPTFGFRRAPRADRFRQEVVRNVCLYHPNSFGFLVPKPCKTAKFFNPLNVFSMSPVFVTTPFLVQKALKTANSEKCVFSCPASKVLPGPPNSLVFLRKPAPGVCSAPKSVFYPEKPANSSPR